MLSASTSNAPQLLFIRHGETPADNPERIDGWMPWGLSPKGYEQALLAASKLQDLHPPVVFSGDLPRQTQTANAIGCALGAKVLVDPGWRSWNTGILTNQLASVVKPHIEFYVQNPDCIIPGGESFNQLLDRAQAAIGRAANASVKFHKTLIVVTSRSVICAVPHALTGAPDDGTYAEVHELPGGSILRAYWDGKIWRVSFI